jgi:hypothetical protein
MIGAGPNLRVGFRYLIQRVAKDGRIPLSVVRGGQPTKVEVPLSSRRPTLLIDLNGSHPSYFVYGPLVFSPGSIQFVGGLMQRVSQNPMSLFGIVSGPLMRRLLDEPAFEGESLVLVASPFFPHPLSRGYGDPLGSVVEAVNGVRVRNLGHLVEVLRDMKEEFVTIEFHGRNGESLVFPRKEIVTATDEILSANGVRNQASPDVLRIWNARAAR